LTFVGKRSERAGTIGSGTAFNGRPIREGAKAEELTRKGKRGKKGERQLPHAPALVGEKTRSRGCQKKQRRADRFKPIRGKGIVKEEDDLA